MILKGKRILLGVCGGIAAYKSVFLLRTLIKEGAEVKVIMTPGSTAFVGPLTFSALSKNPVGVEFFEKSSGVWFNHVEAGMWADLMIIVPATANTIAKMASSICDNLLLAVYLSAKCPVIIAPAMDLDMWKHLATVKNLEILRSQNMQIIEPGTGELASGLHGTGRVAEPEIIHNYIRRYFLNKQLPSFKGKKVLITAGPTHEKIDPVRFIGNNSSGKMGFAIAEVFASADADVTVIHGPVYEQISDAGYTTIAVESAEQMFMQCKELFPQCDIFISAAAVADFTPKHPSASKIKKTKDNAEMQIELKRTTDILATMSQMRTPEQYVVGFALETDNAIENATKKLQEKHLDLIVLNTLSDNGAGFGFDTNKITILDKDNNISTFELKTKLEVAIDLISFMSKKMYA